MRTTQTTSRFACLALACVTVLLSVGCQTPGGNFSSDSLAQRMAEGARQSLIASERPTEAAPYHSQNTTDHMAAKPVIQMIGFAGSLDRG